MKLHQPKHYDRPYVIGTIGAYLVNSIGKHTDNVYIQIRTNIIKELRQLDETTAAAFNSIILDQQYMI